MAVVREAGSTPNTDGESFVPPSETSKPKLTVVRNEPDAQYPAYKLPTNRRKARPRPDHAQAREEKNAKLMAQNKARLSETRPAAPPKPEKPSGYTISPLEAPLEITDITEPNVTEPPPIPADSRNLQRHTTEASTIQEARANIDAIASAGTTHSIGHIRETAKRIQNSIENRNGAVEEAFFADGDAMSHTPTPKDELGEGELTSILQETEDTRTSHDSAASFTNAEKDWFATGDAMATQAQIATDQIIPKTKTNFWNSVRSFLGRQNAQASPEENTFQNVPTEGDEQEDTSFRSPITEKKRILHDFQRSKDKLQKELMQITSKKASTLGQLTRKFSQSKAREQDQQIEYLMKKIHALSLQIQNKQNELQLVPITGVRKPTVEIVPGGGLDPSRRTQTNEVFPRQEPPQKKAA